MYGFVQLELDCRLPGGERLMVLLSSQKRDGFLRQSQNVSGMYSTAENTLLKSWLHFEETATVELNVNATTTSRA